MERGKAESSFRDGRYRGLQFEVRLVRKGRLYEPVYIRVYLPKILKRIEESAPEGADLKSWRY